MNFKTDRSEQLYQALVQLNEIGHKRNRKKQPKLEIGSFIFGSSHVKKIQNQALRALTEKFKKDMLISSLGLEMGASSFIDCLVGPKRCFVETKTSDMYLEQKCLYVLFCHFANIYVLGEHSYFDKNAYSLPGIESVDKYTNKAVRELSEIVAKTLEDSGCERVYASELKLPRPYEVKYESNLVLDKPLVFDGYFTWVD